MNRHVAFTALLILSFFHAANAQDEGAITKKARVISNANTIYLGIGSTISTSGDYGAGFNAQIGFLKRRNRSFSAGPFISYSGLKYNSSKGNNVFIETGGYEIRKNRIKGGDLSLFSAGAVLRFDFIPNERVKRISPHAIIQPFLMLSSRKSLTIDKEEWYRDDTSDNTGDTWYYSGTTSRLVGENWGSKSGFAGGVSFALGVDFIVSSGLSLFLQTGIGLTTPIQYIDTGSFDHNLTGYENDEYPFVKKTFIPVAFSIGVAYNY
jgi:hypothetical protein